MNAWLAKPIPFSLVYCDPAPALCDTVRDRTKSWRAIATMGLCDMTFRAGFSQRTID